MNRYRYGGLKILTNCSQCGSPLVINGPVLKQQCNSCQNEAVFSKKFWNGLIVQLDKNIVEGSKSKGTSDIVYDGFTFKISWNLFSPECNKCKSLLPIDDFSLGGAIRCSNCGDFSEFMDAPSWFNYADTMKIIGADSNVQQNISSFEQVNPISMNCPNCAGALKISQSIKRVTNCEFCSSEFYIPDVIWNRLHPVTVARTWFVRYEGKPQWIIEMEKRNEEQKLKYARILQKKREKVLLKDNERQKDILATEIKESGAKWKSTVIWGYFASVLAGIFAIGFAIIFISPLSKMVGEKLCDGEYIRKSVPTRKGYSIFFYCKKDGKVESMDNKMVLAGLGGGVGLLCSIWTLTSIVLFIRMKKKRQLLQEQLNQKLLEIDVNSGKVKN
ncbi:hypothetical protein KKF34_04155 [Myxococcota bacterium]|nr:hypothetical protein [Myxococcota bacterium]MBU1380195.1 hypothetical protein [Myxococcota bacterium]MBU1496050.1 hypothetical protein [Myxococcota bacterium]